MSSPHYNEVVGTTSIAYPFMRQTEVDIVYSSPQPKYGLSVITLGRRTSDLNIDPTYAGPAVPRASSQLLW